MKTMKDFKGTPGDFEYKRTHQMSKDTWYVITANGKGPVVDVGGKDLSGQIAEAKYLVTDPHEIEANARLFANSKKNVEYLIEAYNELLQMQMNVDKNYFSRENERGHENWERYAVLMCAIEKQINDSL